MENENNKLTKAPSSEVEKSLPQAESLQTMRELQSQIEPYAGASRLTLSNSEQKRLTEDVDEKLVEIRPDGFLYVPQAIVRQTLNQVIGIGQWALVVHNVKEFSETLCYDGSLYIRGFFVARAMGEADYIPSNKNMSWATVYESAKSDCLVRCCKDLGFIGKLWQPQYIEWWKKMYAVRVWRTGDGSRTKPGYYWRRKDAEPWSDEMAEEPVNYDSLNRSLSLVIREKSLPKLEMWKEKYGKLVSELPENQKGILGRMFASAEREFKPKVEPKPEEKKNEPSTVDKRTAEELIRDGRGGDYSGGATPTSD